MADGEGNKPSKGPHRFKPGESGNPAGRPKGAEGLAAYIRQKTRDCFELVDLMIEIAHDAQKASDRIAAIEWLSNRGLGKVTDKLEVGVDDSLAALLKSARERLATR